jgi:muconolactone delta-isomerase
MEYLVTMTTHVPDGTSDEAVGDVRTREAAHSRDLAAQGHLLRLWRAPRQPGEWRSLGLFAAADGGRLEEVLASMPLRVWRTDEVTTLSPHPNDPANQNHPDTEASAGTVEFLITLTIRIPDGTPDRTVDDTRAREAVRARELGDQGHLVRLWSVPAQPGETRTLGLWRAQDPAEMQAILESLPLYAWLRAETTTLGQHPNDPAMTGMVTASG